ncbi:SAM-dependent DNA methyltransferase [Patescibacteria group bacterium]|nr:SAM-dependent DNA methyltransferase [Patescibacteria group bacterium]
MSNISSIISSIQSIMRKDNGVDGDAQRIGQLGWMLFLKILDAREQSMELIEENYKSVISAELQRKNRAEDDEGITGDALIEFINLKLFPKLKNLSSETQNKMAYIVKGVFEDSFNYMKSGTLLRQVINKIDEIDFNRKSELHIFNDIYEKILNDLQNAGNYGEFYTPRAVTQFMVQMLDPQLGQKILDPACGTGGFLTGCIEYLRTHHVKNTEHETLLQESIHGIELKPLPHLLATTNLMLHGIDIPINLRHDDSLSKPIKDITIRDQVDIILANPPFGGTITDGILANFPKSFQTKETASLFMVYIISMLKHGGQGAVVLPDGFLFSEGIDSRIKEKLLTECNLHTIVRLPNNVFAPYATVATNLLFFTKGEATKEIRYYEHKVPTGQKTYNKTNPIKLSEFDAEKTRWTDRTETEVSRKVSVDMIRDRNYNLDVKNPHKGEEAQVLDTAEIIMMIDHNLTQAHETLKQIKESL